MNSAKREKYDAAFNTTLRKSSTSSRDLRRIFPIVFNTLTHTTNQGIKLAVFLLFICLLIYPPKLFAKALDLRQVISKVLLVNQKPAFKLINPQSVDEGRALQFILEASDPDGSACDLNDDGKVNSLDYGALTKCLSKKPIGQCLRSDLNRDGKVNLVDISILNRFLTSRKSADGLVYTASQLPVKSVFDPILRSFSWTPDFEQAGSYTVKFSVWDGMYTDNILVTITVINVNRPPVLQPMGTVNVRENQPALIQIPVSDPDKDKIQVTINPMPQGATFDSQTLALTWKPSFSTIDPPSSTPKSLTLTINASDGQATVIGQLPLQVTNETVPAPTISFSTSTTTVERGEPFTLTTSATSTYGLASVWWYGNNTGITNAEVNITYPPEPVYQSKFTTPVQNPTKLDRVFGEALFTESQAVTNYSFTSSVVINKTGTFSFGANSRDVLYWLKSEPHQASEGSGIARLTITVRDTRPPATPAVSNLVLPVNTLSVELQGTKEVDSSILVNGIEKVAVNNSTEWQTTIGLPNEGDNYFTITSKDQSGNESGILQINIIRDTAPPVVQLTSPTLSNNPSYLLTYTVDENPNSETIPLAVGDNTINKTIADDAGNETQANWLVRLERLSFPQDSLPDNQPPVIAPIENQTVGYGETLSVAFNITDPDGVAPDLDRDGDVDYQDFELFEACSSGPAIQYQDPNCRHADFDKDGDIDQSDFGVYQIFMSGSDQPAEFQYSFANFPQGANFVYATKTLVWTPTVEQMGNYVISLSVSDGMYSVTSDVNIEVVDRTPPVTTANPVGGEFSDFVDVTLSVNEPATIYYTTDGSDPTPASTIYAIPIHISDTTLLKFFAVDTSGNSETIKTETYQRANHPPTIDPILPQQVIEGDSLLVVLTASDLDEEPLTWTADNPPSGSSFSDLGNGTAQFSWNPTTGDAGEYQINVHVFDGTDTTSGILPVRVIGEATATYGYDNLNRLTGVYYQNGKQIEYDYDEVGNRTAFRSEES